MASQSFVIAYDTDANRPVIRPLGSLSSAKLPGLISHSNGAFIVTVTQYN
ncbi:MAG: hypothetical protein KBF98_08455 [Rhodoferax sp.]|nr:hypothetical protein [Rhodoferax sp.]